MTAKHATLDGNEAVAARGLPAQRGHRHLPDHAVVADGRVGRPVGGGRASRTCGAACRRWSRCRARAGRPAPSTAPCRPGSLTTTFTASQGLLLMIPNMYKIAGELTPAVIHVAARVAGGAGAVDLRRPQRRDGRPRHRLRPAGLQLGAGGGRPRPGRPRGHPGVARPVPPLLRRLPHLARGRCGSSRPTPRPDPGHDRRRPRPRPPRPRPVAGPPVIRGTAQNPDVYFQARETVNPYYLACPTIVQNAMDRFAGMTGRRYRLFDYVGAADAERVIVLMGSGRRGGRGDGRGAG